MTQEQQDKELNFKIDQSSKMISPTKSNIISLIALTIMSAAALLIFIKSGMTLYNHHHHHHRQLIGSSITLDPQSTAITDLNTSLGPIMTSNSSPNIPSVERQQALPNLYDTTEKRNYIYSSDVVPLKVISDVIEVRQSLSLHGWNDHPPVNPWTKNSVDLAANQAVSRKKGTVYITLLLINNKNIMLFIC